jgi:ATP-dependent Clp protease ATP-binding subunit ClpA
MASKVTELTTDELREIIESSIERKLTEMFGDPDAGLEIHDSLREQLARQEKDFQNGKRGRPLKDVIKLLELDRDHV